MNLRYRDRNLWNSRILHIDILRRTSTTDFQARIRGFRDSAASRRVSPVSWQISAASYPVSCARWRVCTIRTCPSTVQLGSLFGVGVAQRYVGDVRAYGREAQACGGDSLVSGSNHQVTAQTRQGAAGDTQDALTTQRFVLGTLRGALETPPCVLPLPACALEFLIGADEELKRTATTLHRVVEASTVRLRHPIVTFNEAITRMFVNITQTKGISYG